MWFHDDHSSFLVVLRLVFERKVVDIQLVLVLLGELSQDAHDVSGIKPGLLGPPPFEKEFEQDWAFDETVVFLDLPELIHRRRQFEFNPARHSLLLMGNDPKKLVTKRLVVKTFGLRFNVLDRLPLNLLILLEVCEELILGTLRKLDHLSDLLFVENVIIFVEKIRRGSDLSLIEVH